tara:strand:- start:3098 stop:3850 length:753 start_codon:yes stop_codon:yes gene_type:complete
MSTFAVGRKAFGFCDRCGFRYPLKELKKESLNLSEVDLKVCPSCWDPDHPQNQIGRVKTSDPQALEGPRPDTGLIASRYGDSVRWDFDSSREEWISPYADYTETIWEDGELIVTGESSDLIIQASRGYYIRSDAISLDASVCKYLRIRMKRTAPWISNVNTDGWLGKMYWEHDGLHEGSLSLGQPVWTEMGDPYHILTWDLSGVGTHTSRTDSGWTGTVDKIAFRFNQIGSGSWTSLGSYTIDYIRAEES